MELVFEWDHGISFTQAATVFSDPLARIFADEAHSDEEAREIIVGHSRANGLLMVCFVEPTERRVRIISARRATRSEQHDYEDHVTP